MRVGIVVHSYYLRDTRPRRHAAVLARAGHEVEVICARDAGETASEDIGGVKVRRLPARRRRGSKFRYLFEYVSFTLLAAGALLRRRGRFDAIIVIGVPNFLVASTLILRPRRGRRPRVLLDMRDPLPEFFQAKYGIAPGSLAHKILLLEERWSCRIADGVLTVVGSMADLYARSVDPSKITVVMNAPDTRLFRVMDVRREPTDRTMLYTGTVAERYGVDLAVEALSVLRADIPGLRLRIVGDGDLVETCRSRATALGVADRVEFLAPVPLDQVPGLIASAWLGIQPNRSDALMEHSLSTKILEWASLRLPVVAGYTAPLEAVFGRDSIWLHEPGDLEDLCRCIREAQIAADMSRRLELAQQRAESVDFESQAQKLIAAVEGE
jgi:glycosyltransferase involved in cell wall biosynthesis